MRKQADAEKITSKWYDHNAIKSPATQSAKDWVRINLSLDDSGMTKAMESVYSSGWAFGGADAADRLGSSIGFDWDNWKAGNEAAAALVDYPSGLQNLLNKSGTVIRGLDNTTVDRIGTALALGLSQGLSPADTAKAVNYVIDNPLRSMVIARTETARALIDSNVASYREAKIQRLEWLVGDPCPICAPNAGVIVPIGEEFPSGNVYPPAHPNCVCDVAPVLDDDLQGAVSQGSINQEPEIARVENQDRSKMGDIRIPIEDLRGGSASRFLRPDGTFTPDRQALHDRIVFNAVDGIQPSANPTYTMLGGGPASGKTTVINSGVAEVIDATKAVHINADDIKSLLPETQAMLDAKDTAWAAYTHEESSYLAKRIQNAAMQRSQHIVLDGTGDNGVQSIVGKLKAASDAGYEVNGVYVTVTTEQALARSAARGVRTGRVVPDTVVRNIHAAVSDVFPQIYGRFDSFYVVDNSINPRIIATGGKGKIEITDKKAYNAFLRKAKK